jgi:hypothetical protein
VSDDEGIVDFIERPHVTPRELVQAAIKLINPSQKHYARCMAAIIAADNDMNFQLYIERFYTLGRTKDKKKKLRRRINALETLHELEDPEFPLRGFPRGHRLQKLITTLKEIVATPSSSRVTQTAALNKRIAVAKAYELLEKYSSGRITASKGGKFLPLATLLFGEPKADLLNQCKAHIRAQKVKNRDQK